MRGLGQENKAGRQDDHHSLVPSALMTLVRQLGSQASGVGGRVIGCASSALQKLVDAARGPRPNLDAFEEVKVAGKHAFKVPISLGFGRDNRTLECYLVRAEGLQRNELAEFGMKNLNGAVVFPHEHFKILVQVFADAHEGCRSERVPRGTPGPLKDPSNASEEYAVRYQRIQMALWSVSTVGGTSSGRVDMSIESDVPRGRRPDPFIAQTSYNADEREGFLYVLYGPAQELRRREQLPREVETAWTPFAAQKPDSRGSVN